MLKNVAVMFLFLFRLFCASALCLSTLSTFSVLNLLPSVDEETEEDLGLSQLIEAGASCLGWAFNAAYVFFLLRSGHPCHRGPAALTAAFLLCLVVDAIETRSLVGHETSAWPPDAEGALLLAFAAARAALYLLYAATLLPRKSPPPPGSALAAGGVNGDWVVRHDGGYSMLREEEEAASRRPLGVAKAGHPWISRLVLFWVNPLIKKGRRDAIREPEDVFQLPADMSTEVNSQRFQEVKVCKEDVDENNRVFHSGYPFFAAGKMASRSSSYARLT